MALLLTAILLAACAPDAPLPVSAVSRQWLEIKIMLLGGKGDAVRILSLLDELSASLAGFFASPLGRLYRIQPFDPGFRMESFTAAAGETVAALKTAVRNGEQDRAFALVADIDAALDRLRQMDSRAADSVQMTYFRLFFFFSALIIGVTLLLAMMRRRMEKALYREQQSRSFSRETVMAQEQERARIARELHDSVAQDLWRLSLHAGGIENAAGDERRRLCAELARGQKALLERVRGICDDLIPPDFRHQGLAQALRRLCHDFERRSGIECRVSIQENLRLAPLDPQLQLQCFRLVQEALANIEKHSLSAEAVVVMRNGSAGGIPALLICVSDDGRGFTIPGNDYRRFAGEGHFGIRNMYERAAIVNGTLTIDSESGEGATITLLIPLESPEYNIGSATGDEG